MCFCDWYFRENNDFDVVDSNSSDESSQGETRSGDGREYFLLVDNWYVSGFCISTVTLD